MKQATENFKPADEKLQEGFKVLRDANIHDPYVFKTREQLLSAAILLRTLETDALKPNQTLVFPRHGGWALGLAEHEYLTKPTE